MNKRIHSIHYSSAGRSSGGLLGTGPAGLLGRAVAVMAGGVILLAGLFVSALVFSALLVVGVIAGGWLWWKTRDLRRSLGEQMAQMQRMQAGGAAGNPHPGGVRPDDLRRAGAPPDAAGEVLDGDFIRETRPHGR